MCESPQSKACSAFITPRGRRSFSLTELLVVIGIIVLLVGLLLVGLRTVKSRTERTRTEALMRQFTNACVAFEADHGMYPGVMPEENPTGWPPVHHIPPFISTMENALLHLMGGYRVLKPEDIGTPSEDEFNAWGDPTTTVEIVYPNSWKLRVDIQRIGEGPMIDGKAYPPYFTPDAGALVAVEHQRLQQPLTSLVGGHTIMIPDLVDAWDNPIIYCRQARTRGATGGLHPTATNGIPPQFYANDIDPYVRQSTPGSISLIDFYHEDLPTAEGKAVFSKLLANPAIEFQARGAICLMSAGPDGMLCSSTDGHGTLADPIDINGAITFDTFLANPRNAEEFDDIRIFAGG